jgi:hypothetical protein
LFILKIGDVVKMRVPLGHLILVKWGLYWAFNCMLSKSNQANLGIIWICCIVSMYPMEKRGKTSHPCLVLKMV